MTTKIIEQYINHNGSWVPYEPMIKRNGVFESPENLWVKYNGEHINNTWAVNFTVKGNEKQEWIFRPKIGDFVYSDKTWSSILSETKTCVGVITDVRSKDFDFIALQQTGDAVWATSSSIADVTTETNISLAICDFAGKTNSQNIILAKPAENTAAHKCAAYSTEGFSAGSWFLPSCGQWNVFQLNKTKINASISAAGGIIVSDETEYWTSTQYDADRSWTFDGGVLRVLAKRGLRSSHPFCTYKYNPVPNGVYIYDKDNNRYTKEEWALSSKEISDVCGIGISTDTNSFMVSTNKSGVNYAFGGQGTLISNVPMLDTDTTQNIYIATHGFIYTDVIISQLGTGNAPAEEYAKTYVFGNGQRGYLPSFGELTTLYSYKTQVEEILHTLGLSLWGDIFIQTCTQQGASVSTTLYWPNGNYSGLGKNDANSSVLPFTFLPFQGSTEGIYILDTDNSLITRSNWSIENNNKAVGVVVLLSKCQFVIAPTDSSSTQIWSKGGAQDVVPGVTTTTEPVMARTTDYRGAQNSSAIVAQYGDTSDYAAGWCQSFLFKNGERGYLGSCSEWQEAYNNKAEIDTCMSLIGGTAIATDYYWTSTQCNSSSSWSMHWTKSDLHKSLKSNVRRVRAFAPLNNKRTQIVQNAKIIPNNSPSKLKPTNESGEATLRLRAGKDSTFYVEHQDYVPYSGIIENLSSDLSKEVVLEQGVTVNITVKENTESGNTIPNALVRIQSEDGVLDYITETTEGGMISTHLLNGSYTFTIEKDGYSKAVVTKDILDNINAITFVISKVYNITANVTKTSEPVPDATVNVWEESQDSVISQILSEMGCVLFKRTGDKAGTFIRLDENTRLKYFDGSVAKTDGTEGDVMVYLPEYYYRYENLGGTKFAYRFSRVNLGEDWVHVPASLVGAYKGYVSSKKLYSRSGVTPKGDISFNNATTYSEARGTGYQIIDYYQHCQIAMLFYAKYRNRHSQAVLGIGGAEYNTKTGGTDALGNRDTEKASSGWVNFRGIEGVFGGLEEYVKGVIINNNVWSITNLDNSVRTVKAYSSMGYISHIQAEKGPFFDVIPTSIQSQEQLGENYCAYYYTLGSEEIILSRSGAHAVESNGSIAYTYANDTTTSISYTKGSRLAFRGELTESKDVNSFKEIIAV